METGQSNKTYMPNAGAAAFVTTQWALVLSAGQSQTQEASVALEQLCRAYWYPLYVYIRRRGYAVTESQDMTQAFFARLLEHNWISRADPAKGKFRAFLLSALNHFLLNEWRHAQAIKRGGGVKHISIDEMLETRYALEPPSDLTPDRIYERQWARSVFERALQRLKELYTAHGKAELYEALKEFLSTETDGVSRTRIGSQLGMTSGAVATAVHRLRQHYRVCVREEVAQTVAHPNEVEEEILTLLAAIT